MHSDRIPLDHELNKRTLNTTLRIAQIRSGPFCLTRDFFDENRPCTVKSIRDIQKGKNSNLLKNELFLNI
ncbi:hypothetical protein LEP1GSC043_3736 [Leptospira weilii str. Ecochallenge]|uniref:Uncharacterized protein n=2 Tax=Leptospira weilii TaxID=28184 RepID=N1U4U7_9LEPT|nr:hypothetical protein LEP1GSC051_3424 [Leptospira sp. P2653]EMN90777.1 hypothetical protein LEP1GSC108_2231 [Leptospira weilii str. UI 13098]EMY14047.1 hypothetical protein LEP1GSC043_3736 [Leptospira weilii str. Ecochallenge]OMI16903.1 hypothetical protein BUQ74_12870 [Leptospira weilii serovar Heyan]